MEFSICKLNSTDDIESEECFSANPILLNEGYYKYENITESTRFINITGHLPKNLVCEHCVVRWHYRAGINWGRCEDGTGAIGCGPQEIFRSCSDISILENTSENEPEVNKIKLL